MKKETARKIDFKKFKLICRAITTYDDLYTLINHIAEHICKSFEVKGCSIFLFDDREKELFRVSSCGVSETYLGKGPLPLDAESSELAKGESIFVEDMRTDSRVIYPEAAEKEGIISMLSVPIKYRDAFHGILRIYLDEQWSLHPDDMDSFRLIGDQLGLVVENNGLKNFLDQVKIAMANLPLKMLKGLLPE